MKTCTSSIKLIAGFSNIQLTLLPTYWWWYVRYLNETHRVKINKIGSILPLSPYIHKFICFNFTNLMLNISVSVWVTIFIYKIVWKYVLEHTLSMSKVNTTSPDLSLHQYTLYKDCQLGSRLVKYKLKKVQSFIENLGHGIAIQ